MKKNLIVIVTILTTLTQLIAQRDDSVYLVDISNFLNERKVNRPQGSELYNKLTIMENLPRNARIRKTTRTEVKFKDVTVTQPGTLASLLGNEINNLDSLVVRGSINAEDIHTIWSCSFYGGLTVANLEYANIDGNKLPDHAFLDYSAQLPQGSLIVESIPLRRVILPEGLEEIGSSAFAYAIALEEVNFPSSLKKIGERCFSDCVRLNVNPLVFPEGLEEIGILAFFDCKAMTGKVVLPSTLKRINLGAFFQCRISECIFSEGQLEEIGDAAFYATRLKEVIIPSCQSITGFDHFRICYELKKVHLPEGLTVIPNGFVSECLKLEEFIMPNSIEVIEYAAFKQCLSLKELQLSSNLKSIGVEGLNSCRALTAISFPSSLDTLGEESCDSWKSIEHIYCAAKIPPTCIDSKVNPGKSPFGEYGGHNGNRTPRDTPVYVPVGSADLYRNAWGWDYFTNFIETNDFPSAGINDTVISDKVHAKPIYDLHGRKVEKPNPGNIYIKNGRKILIK